ncbi:hypothetical protein BDB01DRAFT_58922 [Pilobolus umbonatus]|nr:hypothetical protein BDB01DRAFT_58922 [Pilobolus umbonatus]
MIMNLANKRIHSARTSEKTATMMQKSRSEPNCKSKSTSTYRSNIYSSKRKSTGNLRQSISHLSLNKSSHHSHKIWRPPGHYEIPDILGNAYLKPSPPVAFDLRPTDIAN